MANEYDENFIIPLPITNPPEQRTNNKHNNYFSVPCVTFYHGDVNPNEIIIVALSILCSSAFIAALILPFYADEPTVQGVFWLTLSVFICTSIYLIYGFIKKYNEIPQKHNYEIIV